MTHFAVQAVVSPGGVWDPQTHGFWTRFRLSEETRVLLRLQFNMLLHDAIAISIRAPDPEVRRNNANCTAAGLSYCILTRFVCQYCF